MHRHTTLHAVMARKLEGHRLIRHRARTQAEPAAVAEIQRRYGDALYAKHDYDAAMAQYIATIGTLEPSYVIR